MNRRAEYPYENEYEKLPVYEPTPEWDFLKRLSQPVEKEKPQDISTRHVKCLSLTLLLASSISALLGRGILGIIHGKMRIKCNFIKRF